MPQFPGFPSNDFDFHFEEAGGALAGLLMRDLNGDVIPGVLPHSTTLLSAGDGWTIKVDPFVAARSKGRAVLLGGTTEEVIVDVNPSPAANSRIDVLYSLPADVGSGDPVQGVALATGTAGAVPVKPSIPAGAIELGTFRVSAGQSSVAQGTLTETFRFAALTGSLLYVRNRADLNSVLVMEGVEAYVISDGLIRERLGGKWLGDWISFSMPGWTVKTGNGPAARYQRGVVYFRGVLENTNFSGGFTTVGNLPLDIPSPSDSYRAADVGMNTDMAQRARVSGRLFQIYYSEKSNTWINLNSLFYAI